MEIVGAEVAANAVATGKKAILFNPASVNLGAYDLNSDDYDGDMTAYVVDGEILNNIFGDISTPIDKLEIINKESIWEKIFKKASPAGNIYGLIDGLKNHSIETVIDGLEE